VQSLILAVRTISLHCLTSRVLGLVGDGIVIILTVLALDC